MEHKLGAVENAAQGQNGWTVIGVVKNRADESQRPNGTIAFARRPVFEGLACGTAAYAIMENAGVVFYSGHYDLTRADAMEDLATRSKIGA